MFHREIAAMTILKHCWSSEYRHWNHLAWNQPESHRPPGVDAGQPLEVEIELELTKNLTYHW